MGFFESPPEPHEREGWLAAARKAEWLEADGLGGFASGTVAGPRTRRYHALLLAATTPPTGRLVLVNGFDARIETSAGSLALSAQLYAPGVTHPDGPRRLQTFTTRPWPSWVYRLEDGTIIEQEIFVPKGIPAVVLSWRLRLRRSGVALTVRPFLSGRDYHAMHHENGSFRFGAEGRDERITWRPYEGLPSIMSLSNGTYEHAPDWYRSFLYERERERGLDCTEDLAMPGVLHWDLSRGEALWVLSAPPARVSPSSGGEAETEALGGGLGVVETVARLRASERSRRSALPTGLQRAADAYVVRRREGRTIVAGYPWFTDWGRDTFIALRGICLAAGRLDDARAILLEWARAVSEGMLPNRFPDGGETPEYNSVDASLWFIIAAQEYLEALDAAVPASFVEARRAAGTAREESSTRSSERAPSGNGASVAGAARSGRWGTDGPGTGDATAERARDTEILRSAIEAILDGHAKGTRYGIRLDADGLLAAGQSGVQLTWMDARVGDFVITPRIGKPVEIEALWLNALRIASAFSARWRPLFERGLDSFRAKFWNASGGFLYDVVDLDHEPGKTDASLRPNQIFAAGGLPFCLLDAEQARRVVDIVEQRLMTPMGPRSLAPGEPGYVGRYEGGVAERDGAYHQGTVWPWLIGPFVEAWVRVRGASEQAKREARERFLEPLLRHRDQAGLEHISEIADGDPPHEPRGCPFQAWSVGEALRLDALVLRSS